MSIGGNEVFRRSLFKSVEKFQIKVATTPKATANRRFTEPARLNQPIRLNGRERGASEPASTVGPQLSSVETHGRPSPITEVTEKRASDSDWVPSTEINSNQANHHHRDYQHTSSNQQNLSYDNRVAVKTPREAPRKGTHRKRRSHRSKHSVASRTLVRSFHFT